MELTVSLEVVCRLIAQARELEARIPAIDAGDEDEVVDGDEDLDAIEDGADEAIEDELRTMLGDLADEELVEVLALAMVGRGTYDASEWDEAIEEAGEEARGEGSDAIIDQLLDMPMLAACLEAGLTAFDLSCDGIGQID